MAVGRERDVLPGVRPGGSRIATMCCRLRAGARHPRLGKSDHRRIVRASTTHPILSRLTHTPLFKSKILLGTLAGVIVLALGGTAAAYTAFSHTVTVSVDGHESTMRT